jgi:hypothetical protein
VQAVLGVPNELVRASDVLIAPTALSLIYINIMWV